MTSEQVADSDDEDLDALSMPEMGGDRRWKRGRVAPAPPNVRAEG